MYVVKPAYKFNNQKGWLKLMLYLLHFEKTKQVTRGSLGLPAAIVVIVIVILLSGGKDILPSALQALHFR
jgi:hypothetical protein